MTMRDIEAVRVSAEYAAIKREITALDDAQREAEILKRLRGDK